MDQDNPVLETILNEVEHEGSSTVPWIVLRNMCFQAEPVGELARWSERNNLDYEYREMLGDGRDKNKIVITFHPKT